METRLRRVSKDSPPPPPVDDNRQISKDNFDLLFNHSGQPGPPTSPLEKKRLANGKSVLLKEAIERRLGIPYRFHGEDDRGYDCSGFVWSVFRDAGADMERTNARSLWQQLPKATKAETRKFGTLVFFRGTNHVGIVRDAESFYHASRSRGVTISYFDDYWRKQITGYRRAPEIDVASVSRKLSHYGSWPVLLKNSKAEEQ
ncbi:MAG: C40 family peptidase [Blastocatellia bacterium]|nr:C40 family peptidase [Blastocatellia bacterium]